MSDFEIVCEIEPPVSADMGIVREQIAVLRRSCDAFLVPDSHLGRATVSSIAVAHEVAYLGARAIACINARDRNLLGFQRDLLTARAYGVDRMLLVYGDRPTRGDRSSLTVRQMIAAAREFADTALEVGVAADITKPLPEWKREADYLFTQITFDHEGLENWVVEADFAGRVFAGIVVLASEKMARGLADLIPSLDIPSEVLEAVTGDSDAGVELAIRQIQRLSRSSAIDGVHVVPARRYRETALALSNLRDG